MQLNELKNRSFVIVDMKTLKDKNKKPQVYGEHKEPKYQSLSMEQEALQNQSNCINDYYS